jgi:hypothetical protein
MIVVLALADLPRPLLRCDLKSSSRIHTFCYQRKYGFRHNRRDAISYHSETMPNGRMESKIVRKTLESSPFPDSYDTWFIGVDRAHRLKRSAIVSGAGAKSWTLAGPAYPTLLPAEI